MLPIAACSVTAGSILDSSELRSRLSDPEKAFTQNFFVAMGRHLKTSVLDELPPHYQSLVSKTAVASRQLVIRVSPSLSRQCVLLLYDLVNFFVCCGLGLKNCYMDYSRGLLVHIVERFELDLDGAWHVPA